MAIALDRIVAGIGEHQTFKEPLRYGAIIELNAVQTTEAQPRLFVVSITNPINGPIPNDLFINVVVKNNTPDQRIKLKLASRKIVLLPEESGTYDVDPGLVKDWEILGSNTNLSLSLQKHFQEQLNASRSRMDEWPLENPLEPEVPTSPTQPVRSNRIWLIAKLTAALFAFWFFVSRLLNQARTV